VDHDFSMSQQYLEAYPDVGFGLTLISGCRHLVNPAGFDAYKRKLLRKMRRRDTLAQISNRIEIYADFFKRFGFDCPLTKHLKRTINSGFPRYSLFVDAHFMAEMCAGILVAVTDYQRFEGNLQLDVADEEEICAGMGGRNCLERLLEIKPELKTIVTSGSTSAVNFKTVYNVGNAVFVEKPYQLEDLLRMIRQVLDDHP